MRHMNNLINKLDTQQPLITRKILAKDKSHANYESPLPAKKGIGDMTYEERMK